MLYAQITAYLFSTHAMKRKNTMNPDIIEADLQNTLHQEAIVFLLNEYAKDLQGYKRSLPEAVLNELIPGMMKIPAAIVFLARVDEQFAGMAICFIGFSTFYARPVINIHDFTVLNQFRRQGIGKKLVAAVEQKAMQLNCCKLTLEVQEKNIHALRLYEQCGFDRSILDESEGQALFLSKYLQDKV
jgi:ribosomal protein S18 acetylase RimI-like enzyme